MKGHIELAVNRAPSSSKKCAYPPCENKDDLHCVPTQKRQESMQRFEFFIPVTAKLCRIHGDLNTWFETELVPSGLPFTAEQILEMVRLLRTVPKPLKGTLSGMAIA